MSGRGLQRAAAVAEAAEAAGLNSASPAVLQCLTPSSPGSSGNWTGGGRQPCCMRGLEARWRRGPGWLLLYLGTQPGMGIPGGGGGGHGGEEGGDESQHLALRSKINFPWFLSVNAAKKAPRSSDHCGSTLTAPPPAFSFTGRSSSKSTEGF